MRKVERDAAIRALMHSGLTWADARRLVRVSEHAALSTLTMWPIAHWPKDWRSALVDFQATIQRARRDPDSVPPLPPPPAPKVRRFVEGEGWVEVPRP